MPSVSHCFIDMGVFNNFVRLGGYVITISPLTSGSVTLGKPNGKVGFCHKSVGAIFPSFRFHQLLFLFHPAVSRGKNSRCPLGFLPGPPACTKSPRISNICLAPKVCSKPYDRANGFGSNQSLNSSTPNPCTHKKGNTSCRNNSWYR